MTEITDQLDPGVLARRLSAAVIEQHAGEAVTEVRELAGGSSGLTFAALLHTNDGHCQPIVVKVAPPGLAPVRNRDVLRQAIILRALEARAGIPVPTVIVTDPGEPPQVPPLFAMESVPGDSFEPLIDADGSMPPPGELRDRAFDAVRVLGRLHTLDVAAVGLLAEPVVGLAEELARWERSLRASGIDLGELPNRCFDTLRRRLPAASRPSLVHGDFRLGNHICLGPSVRAVLDWEIWTVSDPRIDLGWFLMTIEPDGLPSAVRTSAPGLPNCSELLEAYERVVEEPVADLHWFSALARVRSAAAMSLNIKHNRRRPNPSPRIEAYAAILPDYLDAALSLIDG